MNNTNYGSAVATKVGFSVNPRLGWGTGADYFRGYISEVMIFDRELTADERVTVSTNYLYKRYTAVKALTMKTIATTILAFLGIARCAFAQGTIVWDESVNGPFSHDFRNPTLLNPFQPGTNSIVGATEVVPTGSDWAGYPDYFVITVPANTVVTPVFLAIGKPDVWLWIGDSSYLNALSYLMNPSSGSLLPQLSLGSIGGGTYGMYMDNHDQQAVTSIASYRLDFFVQGIPEPTTFSLLLAGSVLIGVRRRKITRANLS